MDYPHHFYCENVKRMAVVALYLKKSQGIKLGAALERAFSGSDMPSGLHDQAVIAAKNRIKFMQQETAKQPSLPSIRRKVVHIG